LNSISLLLDLCHATQYGLLLQARKICMCKESFIVGLVSGILALAGVFLGVLLTRRTEYQKWLRQERSAAFAEFLRQLHTVIEKAIPILSSLEQKQQQDSKVTGLFLGIKAQEYIVRLYLPANDRESFSELTKQLWLLYSPSTQMESRIPRAKEILRKIQSLFERTIDGKPSACRAWRSRRKSL
jgi:hypothetical protein